MTNMGSNFKDIFKLNCYSFRAPQFVSCIHNPSEDLAIALTIHSSLVDLAEIILTNNSVVKKNTLYLSKTGSNLMAGQW